MSTTKTKNKKTLADLINQPQVDVEKIKKASDTIHKKEKPKPESMEGKTKKKPSNTDANQVPEAQRKRVSVDLPFEIYMKAQEQAFLENKMSLKNFVLKCVQEYLQFKSINTS